MKNEAVKIFQRKKKSLLESWIKYQLADQTLREDLMSNEDLRTQSDELLNSIVTQPLRRIIVESGQQRA